MDLETGQRHIGGISSFLYGVVRIFKNIEGYDASTKTCPTFVPVLDFTLRLQLQL